MVVEGQIEVEKRYDLVQEEKRLVVKAIAQVGFWKIEVETLERERVVV